MKRVFLSVFVLLSCFVLGQTPLLRGEKQANPDPALIDADNWMMVIIPDPQAYARYTRNQGIFELMTAWIAENRDTLNIQQVVCVGDLVESNGLQEPDGVYANQTGLQMWASTSRAFERLDGLFPYILCTGNHDYGPDIFPEGTHYGVRSAETRDSHFNEFFPIDRNPALQGVLVETAPNAFGVHTLENAAYEWTVPGGKKMLAVALEFAPRDEVVEWAKELFARPEYRDHFGIVATHSYILDYHRGVAHIDSKSYSVCESGNSGKQIWEKLVKPAENIRMVLCGHISKADDIYGCTGFRVDPNDSGKPVYQILFDTQAIGGGWDGNGGDGWLQLLEFNRDLTHVHVRTFSPLLSISPVSRSERWLRNEKCEFEFNIE
ncbi:MAG: metallophosphoesterase [Thermoguttaceae bacterium]|jgi:hypothetical protein